MKPIDSNSAPQDIPKYEKPEDITWQEYRNVDNLSKMLAGIEASVDREIKNAQDENSEDGASISQNEYNNLKKWYKKINIFYSQASLTVNQAYNDFADKLKLTLDKLKAIIDNKKSSTQIARSNISFSPEQQHIKNEFEKIINNIDYESASSFNLKSASLGLENIIVKYKSYNKEDEGDSSLLSSSQIAKIRELSTYIDKLAKEKEVKEVKEYTDQNIDSSFYKRNAQAYAKVMGEKGHRRNYIEDIRVVFPEYKQ